MRRGRLTAPPSFAGGATAAVDPKKLFEEKTALIKRYARAQFLANYLQKAIESIEANADTDWARLAAVQTFLKEAKETINPNSPDQTSRIKGCLERLQAALGQYTTQTCLDALPLILLDDASFDDSQGIRTEISRRLLALNIQGQQLHKKGEESMGPLVALDERGLILSFDSNEGACQLAAMLKTLGVCSDVVEGEAPSVPGYHSATHQLVIPHESVNQLLSVLQFLPTNVDAVVNDLYKAVNEERQKKEQPALNSREQYLLQAAARAPQVEDAKDIPVYVPEGGMARMPHPTKAGVDILAIDIAAEVPVKETKEHIIILFDDSGSMQGAPIAAANRAVRDLLKTLPDNVLISLQPFNQKTVFCRQLACDAKSSFKELSAPGITPLIQILMSSAVFMRSSGDNPLISQDEIDHTVVMLLTDGQENSTAAAAVASMQTSLLHGLPFQKLRSGYAEDGITVVRDGLTDENITSYGTPMMPCRQLPAVLPVGIGTGVDRGFLESLGEELSCPAVFVNGGARCDDELREAFNVLAQMRSRIGHAYVGVMRSDGTCIEAREVKSLFNKHQRRIYVEVPAGESVYVQLKVGGQAMQVAAPTPGDYLDDANKATVMEAYAASEYMTIKKAYDLALSQVSVPGGRQAMPVRRGRWVPSEEEVPVAADAEFEQKKEAALAKRAELKAHALEQLQSLKAQLTQMQMTQTNVFARVTTLITALEKSESDPGYVNADLAGDRQFMASHTQGRLLGVPVQTANRVKPKPNDPFEAWCARIVDLKQPFDQQGLLSALTDHPAWLNEKRQDQHENTIFMLLLRRWRHKALTPEERQAIEHVIIRSLQVGDIRLTETDSVGNTALHNAAWWGATDSLAAMLEYAKANDQLATLRVARNQNSVGATFGETVLDNILMSPALSQQQKEHHAKLLLVDQSQDEEAMVFKLLRRVAEPEFDMTALQAEINQMQDLNVRSGSELEQYGTLLHCLLYQSQNRSVSIERRVQLKEVITKLLEERGDDIRMGIQNLSGQTTLHAALWYGHFDVSWQIIERADTQGFLEELLTLRNHQNETPLMNLASRAVLAQVTIEHCVSYAKILERVYPHLTVLQIAELSAMLRVSQASLQGYSIFWHLDKWPVAEYHRLLSTLQTYLGDKTKAPEKHDLMHQLAEKLSELRPDSIDDVLAWVRAALNDPKNKAAFSGFFSSTVKTSFDSASRMLQAIQEAIKSAYDPVADVDAAEATFNMAKQFEAMLKKLLQGASSEAAGPAMAP